MAYYWPDMGEEAVTVQEKCQNCWLLVEKEESYAVFMVEDWRTPFMGYLTQGILLADKKLDHQPRKLVVRYFYRMGSYSKRGITRIL